MTGSGLTAGTQDQEIIAALATRLKFITDPLNQQAGACGEITLQARDTYANPAPIQGSDVNVALAFTGSDVEFFTDNLCSAPLAGDLPLLVTESQKTFYARSIEEGTIALSASASGFTGDGQTHTITAAAPTRLAFGNDPLTTPAGSCSAAAEKETSYKIKNPTENLEIQDMWTHEGVLYALDSKASNFLVLKKNQNNTYEITKTLLLPRFSQEAPLTRMKVELDKDKMNFVFFDEYSRELEITLPEE